MAKLIYCGSGENAAFIERLKSRSTGNAFTIIDAPQRVRDLPATLGEIEPDAHYVISVSDFMLDEAEDIAEVMDDCFTDPNQSIILLPGYDRASFLPSTMREHGFENFIFGLTLGSQIREVECYVPELRETAPVEEPKDEATAAFENDEDMINEEDEAPETEPEDDLTEEELFTEEDIEPEEPENMPEIVPEIEAEAEPEVEDNDDAASVSESNPDYIQQMKRRRRKKKHKKHPAPIEETSAPVDETSDESPVIDDDVDLEAVEILNFIDEAAKDESEDQPVVMEEETPAQESADETQIDETQTFEWDDTEADFQQEESDASADYMPIEEEANTDESIHNIENAIMNHANERFGKPAANTDEYAGVLNITPSTELTQFLSQFLDMQKEENKYRSALMDELLENRRPKASGFVIFTCIFMMLAALTIIGLIVYRLYM